MLKIQQVYVTKLLTVAQYTGDTIIVPCIFSLLLFRIFQNFYSELLLLQT